MDQCPVIHKVSDHGAEVSQSSGNKYKFSQTCCDEQQLGGVCPVTGMKSVELDLNTDEIGETPSLQEYKKLRQVMAMITRFYRDGSEAKKAVCYFSATHTDISINHPHS